MNIKNLQASDLPKGTYEAEIFDLFTVRIPKLMIVWLLNIKSSEFQGSRIEYSYIADECSDLTASNFKAVGIVLTNIQTVLENSKLIQGQKIKVLVKTDGVWFAPHRKSFSIKAVKVAKTPF